MTSDSTAAPVIGELTDVTGAGASEESTHGYVRSPLDLLRLVALAVSTALFLVLTLWVDEAILGFEQDILDVFAFLTPAVERVLQGGIELLSALIILAVYVTPLATRRYRLFGYVALASVLALGAMGLVGALVDDGGATVLANELAERAGVTQNAAGSIQGIAQTTAMFVTVAPFVGRRWRLTGAVAISLLVLLRLLVSVQLPAELFLTVPLGALCGTVVLLLFGRPDRHPTPAAIVAALQETGLAVTEVHPAAVASQGSTPYYATLADGGGLFVKVLGSQERAADLLYRTYRFMRLKDVGDARPFSSLRRTVEHEALVALMARDVGVRTPRLRGVVEVGTDSMLLAYDRIDGSSLDGVPDDVVDDGLMARTWDQVAVLRRHRIGHRDLRRANLFVAADGEPWMLDFGFSEVAVAEAILDADVAQLLASLAVVAGPERAVDSAIDVLGVDAVGAALPRLQPRALSGATQASLKEHPGRLKALQQEVIERCGVEDVQYAELERVNRNTMLTIAALVLATYFLFPQLADLPGIVDQIGEANWAWTPLLLATAAMTYVAAGLSLSGAVPDRLPFGPVVVAQVASSFASKLAPAAVGGMALNVRFLQKLGVDRPVAASGVGLNTVAGIIGHFSLIAIFIVWAGRDAFGSFELPDPSWFIVGIGIAVAIIVVGLAIPSVRHMMKSKLLPMLAEAAGGIVGVLRRPLKMVLLFGGSVLITLSNLLTLYVAVLAFGGGLPFATVGAVFLVGAAVASAAPTPGGLGAMEAALIGGLVAAGLDDAVAVPAVFLFRLFTFWLPVLPGWFCFTWMQRHDYL